MRVDVFPLSAVDLEKTDEQLGWWLIKTCIGHQAQKKGFALNAIPKDWAVRFLEETAKMDSDAVKNAPLESALRKACAGDMEVAGRMLRNYMFSGAEALVRDKYAAVGIKHAKGRKTGGKKAAAVKKATAASWHDRCVNRARVLLGQGKKPSELSGILAKQFDVTPQTIRTVLKNAKVK